MVGRIVAAVDLPVTMDLEAGYGNVARLLCTRSKREWLGGT